MFQVATFVARIAYKAPIAQFQANVQNIVSYLCGGN